MTAAIADEDSSAAYAALLDRLQARGRFGMRLGLARTRAMLKRLGDPQRELRGVLIGGTNGKGSIQALVGAALTGAGYRVAQTPKPHLVSYRERIQVDGQPIAVADFTAVVGAALDAAEHVEARHGPPTEFEVLTAAAFAWFARAETDVAVIEVGLGGRLDATNVWQGGLSAISNVSLDHTEHLGPTVELIAREKAHIIKRGDAAVITGADQPALGVIRRRASRMGVPLHVVEPLPVLGMDAHSLRLTAPDGDQLRVGLLGRHQAANAAVAWAILDGLAEAGIATVPVDDRRYAFAAVRWPGRLELVNRPATPTVLLDGAHNPAGLNALAAALSELLPQLTAATPTVLMGVLDNHWQEDMLEPLNEALPGASMIATRVPGADNSMAPTALAAAWGAGATPIGDTDLALDSALAVTARSGGLLVVCGSLYLVGHVRARLT